MIEALAEAEQPMRASAETATAAAPVPEHAIRRSSGHAGNEPPHTRFHPEEKVALDPPVPEMGTHQFDAASRVSWQLARDGPASATAALSNTEAPRAIWPLSVVGIAGSHATWVVSVTQDPSPQAHGWSAPGSPVVGGASHGISIFGQGGGTSTSAVTMLSTPIATDEEMIEIHVNENDGPRARLCFMASLLCALDEATRPLECARNLGRDGGALEKCAANSVHGAIARIVSRELAVRGATRCGGDVAQQSIAAIGARHKGHRFTGLPDGQRRRGHPAHGTPCNVPRAFEEPPSLWQLPGTNHPLRTEQVAAVCQPVANHHAELCLAVEREIHFSKTDEHTPIVGEATVRKLPRAALLKQPWFGAPQVRLVDLDACFLDVGAPQPKSISLGKEFGERLIVAKKVRSGLFAFDDNPLGLELRVAPTCGIETPPRDGAGDLERHRAAPSMPKPSQRECLECAMVKRLHRRTIVFGVCSVERGVPRPSRVRPGVGTATAGSTGAAAVRLHPAAIAAASTNPEPEAAGTA